MRRTNVLLCRTAIVAAVLTGALTACGVQAISGQANVANGPAGPQKAITVSQLADLVGANTSRAQTVHATVRMTGSIDMTETGLIRFGAQPALSVTANAAQLGQFDVVMLGNTVYMKLPAALRGSLPVSTPWLSLNTTGSGQYDRLLAPFIQAMRENSDPAATVAKVKSAGTITATGQDTVNGQPATHYTISVDLRKLIASLGSDDATRQIMQFAVNAGVRLEALDVWVNSANLPVKVTTATDMPNPRDTSQTLHMNVAETYTGWGQPVTITAPPANQVSEVPGN